MVRTSTPPSPPKRSPKRKVLHERSQSQSNKIPQRGLGLETKQDSFSSTVFPTKPSQVLLPSSIKKQNGGNGLFGASFAARVARAKEKVGGGENRLDIPSASNANTLGIGRSVSELRDLYENQTVSRPSTRHSTRPSSGRSTPFNSPPLRGQVLNEKVPAFGRILPSGSEEVLALPSPRDASFSIKKIASDASLPPPPPTPPNQEHPDVMAFENPSSDLEVPAEESSSPNLIALGSSSSAPEEMSGNSSSPNLVVLGHSSSRDMNPETNQSSPNIVPLQLSSAPIVDPIGPSSSPDALRLEQRSSPPPEPAAISSSPNVVQTGLSSPNYISTKYDDSPEGSPESLRTIKKRRSEMVQEQPSASTFSTPSEQFSSSPPNHEKSVTSASSVDLPFACEPASSSPLPHRKGSDRAHEDLQAAIESSPAPQIQYPVVRAPRVETSESLAVQKRAPRMLDGSFSPARCDPHLSTVPSEWSSQNIPTSSHSLDSENWSDATSIPEMPPAAYIHGRDITDSCTSIIPEADRNEATDMISDLRGPHLHNKTSGFLSFLSGDSRSSSMRSYVLRRPNSSSSLSSTVRFPAWARRYYSQGANHAFYALRPETSSSNLSQYSRPSTARTPAVEQPSISMFRPRTRSRKNARESHLLPGIGPLCSNPSQLRLSSLPLDPADPRSHWAGAEQASLDAELQNPPPLGSRSVNEWSPHLFPDNRASGRSRWLAPSIDEKSDPIFTWRNAHMVGFMLGFVFPISWFIAALLPLPPIPEMRELVHDPETGDLSLQAQLDHRTAVAEEIKYANLRWWRNLNRFMCIVGLVIIAIVVSHSLLASGYSRTGKLTLNR
jgi:hypothetical protein